MFLRFNRARSRNSEKSDTFFQHKLMDSVHLKSVRGI